MMTKTFTVLSMVASIAAAQSQPSKDHGQMANCPLSSAPSSEEAGSWPGSNPTSAGQDAFGAIAEIVQLLEADPATDWTKVDIDALREHLIDMSELALHAAIEEKSIAGGLEMLVTGSGRTRDAIQRMVPAHAGMIRHVRQWNVDVATTENGVTLRVTSKDTSQIARIRGLGLFGFMTLGHHHGPHHLAIARGRDPHR